jgi:hypothetical protein
LFVWVGRNFSFMRDGAEKFEVNGKNYKNGNKK